MTDSQVSDADSIAEQLLYWANQMKPSGLGGRGLALNPAAAPILENGGRQIKRLLVLLEVAYDGLLNHHLHDEETRDEFTNRVGAALSEEARRRVAFGEHAEDCACSACLNDLTKG